MRTSILPQVGESREEHRPAPADMVVDHKRLAAHSKMVHEAGNRLLTLSTRFKHQADEYFDEASKIDEQKAYLERLYPELES